MIENLVKNTDAFKTLKAQFEKGSLAHAIFVHSEDFLYSKTFCLCLAKLILRNNDKVERYSHPDFKFFDETKNLKVKEDIEPLLESIELKPMESENKVVLCYSTLSVNKENNNKAIQNKLLKTLEEPPKNTYFIFASTSVSGLLPTFLSRMLKINLQKLSKDDVEFIYGNSAEFNNKTQLAEKFKSKGFKDKFSFAKTVFTDMKTSADVVKFSRKYVLKKDELDELLLVFEELLEQIICGSVVIFGMNKVAAGLCIESLNVAKQKNMANLSVNSILDNFYLDILEAKFKASRN